MQIHLKLFPWSFLYLILGGHNFESCRDDGSIIVFSVVAFPFPESAVESDVGEVVSEDGDGFDEVNISMKKAEDDVSTITTPSPGLSKEEVAVYVCLGLACVLISVCCFFCCKHCGCPLGRRGRPRNVYREMIIPARLNVFTRSTDCSAPLVPENIESGGEFSQFPAFHSSDKDETIVLSPLPTSEELYQRNRDPTSSYSYVASFPSKTKQ